MYDAEDEKRTAELERQLAQTEARRRAPRPLPGSAGDLRALLRLDGGPFDLVAAIVVVITFIVFSGPVLTAIVPQTGLWTSWLICGESGQLVVRSSYYSYKPGQSGISFNFQCLAADGAHDASFLAVGALQSVVITVVVAIAAVVALRRWRRRQRASEEWVI